MTRLGQARARTAGSNSDPSGSMMQDSERNEDLMRSNPDSALAISQMKLAALYSPTLTTPAQNSARSMKTSMPTIC